VAKTTISQKVRLQMTPRFLPPSSRTKFAQCTQ